MYGGGIVDTWSFLDLNYTQKYMAVTFLPMVDNTSLDKKVMLRAHYTNSWMDYPNATYGNWTCADQRAMEDGTYGDSKPWDAADSFAQWIELFFGWLFCIIFNIGNPDKVC